MLDVLKNLVPNDWNVNFCLIRAYSIVGLNKLSKDEIESFHGQLRYINYNDLKLIVSLGNGFRPFFENRPHFFISQTGDTCCTMEKIERNIPVGDILMMISPLEISNLDECLKTPNNLPFQSAEIGFDQCMGLLKLHYGNNVGFSRHYTNIVNMESGEATVYIDTEFTRPNDIQGLEISDKKNQELKKLALNLSKYKTSLKVKSNILRGLELIELASLSAPEHKMAFYFMALECICGKYWGKASFANKLSKHYKKDQIYALEELRLASVLEYRANYFHFGEFKDLDHASERYLHCLCLDFIRALLGFDCKKYTENFLSKNQNIIFQKVESGVKPNFIKRLMLWTFKKK